jgi:heme/copper-type cytochrome/quinol oxidase subunit 2
MKTIETWFFIGLLAIILVFGAGMYYAGSVSNSANAANAQNSSKEYNVTMVITNQNYLTSAGRDQPAFYLLENGKLTSSAQLYLPGNELVRMTIINYDSGPGTTSSTYSRVTGTLNNTEYIVNDTNVNGTTQPGMWVKSISSANLAHTFTIQKMGLNIMIPSHSIVVAYFHTPTSGVYNWQCEVDCGAGTSGWGGAMTTPGWMQGQVIFG